MNSILGCEYNSEPTADHGFEFQEELLLHVCLRLIEMDCQSFSVGLEVKEFPKLDDIVLEFEMSGKKFLFFLQSKHVLNEKKMIHPDHFFSPKELNMKDQPKDLWKNFNLCQYIRSPMNELFQEKLQPAVNHLLRYVIITNLVYVDDYEEENDNEEVSPEDSQDTVEVDEDFQELFLILSDRGADIFKFGEKSNAKIEALIDHILKVLVPASNKEKEKKNLPTEKVINLGSEYFRERIVVISRSPNLKKLTDINDKMLSKQYKIFNPKTFRKVLRRNLFEFISIDPDTRRRKTLEKVDFERIVSKTIVEVDFPTISETFLKELPDWIEFTDAALKSLQEELIKCNKFSCKGGKKLVVWKIYGASKLTNQEILVIPNSKISETHIKALEMYDRHLILYLDDGKFPETLSDNKNIIFIGNDLQRDNSCLFNELSEKSKEYFFQMEFSLQGTPIPLESVPDSKDDNYTHFMDEALIRIANGKNLHLGRDLPRDKIPTVYLPREPFTLIQFDEMFFVDTKSYCTIITGGPGMGKSCGLQNAAIYFKEKRPFFWVEFIDLKRYSKAFFDRSSSSFTEDEAVSFLMDRLATYSPDNKEMEQRLLKIHLNGFAQKDPQVFVFFDGFDEISPTYEEIVLNLIKMLSKRFIKSFITSRVHCVGVFKELKLYPRATIKPYTVSEMEEFLEKYWNWRLPNTTYPENIVKFRDQFFKYFGEFKAILETPILLRMLAEIVTRDCERYCENLGRDSEEIDLTKFENVDTWTIYGIIFDMSFENFYEKEGIDQTSNLAMTKRASDMKTVRDIHKYLAIKELNLMELIPFEADVSKDVEILARGFVTRTDDGEFFFVHRTYAEYFCAESLFEEIENYNVSVMNYLSKSPDKVINDFLYRLLIEKIKTKHVKIERIDIIGADMKGFLLKHFTRFFDSFLLFVWKNSISDVYVVLEFIEEILYKPEIIQFNFDEYYTYLDKQYIFIKPQQLLFVVEYTIRLFPKNFKQKLLRKSDDFIRRKISGHDCEFLEEYYNSLVKYFVLTQEEVIEEYFNALKKNVMSTWFRSDLFFLYFKMKSVIYDQELNFVKNQLMQKEKLNDFDTHYICHLALHEEIQNESFEFINNLAVFLHQEDKIYQLLSFYELDHKCRKDFVEKVVQAFSRMGLKFNCKGNNSMLYYFWKNDKNYLMGDFLTFLKLEDVEELTASPHFNGKSLLEFVHSNENGDYINEKFITFIFAKLGKEQLYEYLSPCSESVNIQQTIRRDLNVCLALGKKIGCDENEETNVMQELILRILDDKFNWKRNTGNKICFLHSLVSLELKHVDWIIPNLVYNYLMADNLFLSEVRDADGDGNTPLHLAGSSRNTEFFEHLCKFIEDKKILMDLMIIENNKKQNFLHCFQKSDEMDDTKFFIYFKKLIKKVDISIENLLLKQDEFKKTPFHDQSVEFFIKFITLVPKERLDELFSIQDVKNNTLFHTLTRNESYGFGTISNFLRMNQRAFTNLKEHLLKTNDEGQSPLNLSRDRKNESLFNYLTDIVTNVPS